MNNKTRWMGVLFGAAALSGLTYTVARRGSLRRAAESPLDKSVTRPLADASELAAPSTTRDWESIGSAGPNLHEPLDLALNLGGVFDAAAFEEPEVTVRASDHVPPPASGDDEEAPGADDLGRNWLAQATQSERSLSELDLVADIDNLAEPIDDDKLVDIEDEIGEGDLGELDQRYSRV